MPRTTRLGTTFSPFCLDEHGPGTALPDGAALCAAPHFALESALANAQEDTSDCESEGGTDEDLSGGGPGAVEDPSGCDEAPMAEIPARSEGGTYTKAERKRQRMRGKRQQARVAAQKAGGDTLKGVTKKRRLETTPIAAQISPDQLPVASSGWIGYSDDSKERPPIRGLEELLGRANGLKLVNWSGQSTHPIIDNTGHIFGLLAGQPKGSEWADVIAEATSAIQRAAANCSFSDEDRSHRRGDFRALACGISFGGGQKAPMNRRNSARNKKALEGLCQNPAIIRISGFAANAFAAYAPRVHALYSSTLSHVIGPARKPALKRNFSNSPFAALTVNFGPRTVTRPHRDRANLAFGWCAITALGSYNADVGGHLVLQELGLIIRFPPGSTVLIPSALITHFNTPIQDGESRYSLTQYTAGGIFRYSYNGLQSDKSILRTATAAQLQQRTEDVEGRFVNGLEMFSTMDKFA